MIIEHDDNGKKGRFFIQADDKPQAEMTYTWAGEDRLIIDHTDVSEELRGSNAGKQLLMELVDFVRKKGVKVIPLCPFANAMFSKMPEIRDVL